MLIESLEVTGEHPLLGIGPGNFPIISGSWRVTHNAYTQMSAEGGIPAFLLYVLILWRAIANVRAVRNYRSAGKEARLFSMALEASLFAYLVGSFFASVAYLLFPYCLVAYSTGLRLSVKGVRQKQDLTVKSQLPPPEVETAIWQ